MGVKLKFRPSSSKGKKGSVHFQFIYRNEIRHVPSGYNVYPDEWHDSFACIVIPENTDSERKEYLREAFKDLSEKLATFKKVFAALKWQKRIIPSIRSLNYAHKLVGETKLAGKTRTVETYQTALNSFERFLKETDRNGLEEMGSGLVGKYGEWLQRNGICLNTMSFYMRNLRSMYNQAVAKGVLEQQQPFSNVYTGSKEVVRFAVPLDTIRRIRDLDLSADPRLDFARDIFMFSFYTRGMSFIDIANLKKEDLKNGFLTYHPR